MHRLKNIKMKEMKDANGRKRTRAQRVTRSEVVVGRLELRHLNSLLRRHLLYMLQSNELVLKELLNTR
jgi:hypothetical protein